MTDLINQLRTTASKGISVWGDLQKEAANRIEMLTEDRDAWKQAHDEQVTKLLEISANRDEYQVEADGMAAAHKVERDALTAERDHWKDQHKECTRLLGEALQEATDMTAERDALKDAARLALTALNRAVPQNERQVSEQTEAIAALKAVLK